MCHYPLRSTITQPQAPMGALLTRPQPNQDQSGAELHWGQSMWKEIQFQMGALPGDLTALFMSILNSIKASYFNFICFNNCRMAPCRPPPAGSCPHAGSPWGAAPQQDPLKEGPCVSMQ